MVRLEPKRMNNFDEKYSRGNQVQKWKKKNLPLTIADSPTYQEIEKKLRSLCAQRIVENIKNITFIF